MAVRDWLRVIFIENYNVSKAEMIIPAADISVQISTAGMEASGTGNMKLAISGALTVGTEDGANVEMHQMVGDKWWPFSFGGKAEENQAVWEGRQNYNPWEIYLNDPMIHKVVDALRDGSLVETEEEHKALSALFHTLLETQYSSMSDKYFVLRDLPSFYQTQKKVEQLYLEPSKWAEYSIHNMAAMGVFSTDQSIHNYASYVWGIKACPVDLKELEKVRKDYSDHDKCRIF
jgi:starch phosphorylase